jgi:hypothetical protein
MKLVLKVGRKQAGRQAGRDPADIPVRFVSLLVFEFCRHSDRPFNFCVYVDCTLNSSGTHRFHVHTNSDALS